MFCEICNGSGRYYTQVDISGAMAGGRCPGVVCSCQIFGVEAAERYRSSLNLICPVCQGNGRIYSQLDVSSAMAGGPCPGRSCPICNRFSL